MGTFNPLVPWSELERRLSGRPSRTDREFLVTGEDGRRTAPVQPPNAGVPRALPGGGHVPYAELHCHSSFSFLDGASTPEALVEEAVRLGLEALAITDHNGCYAAVRFAEAARESGLPTVFGAELSLPTLPGSPIEARAGALDPESRHLVILARDPEGYARLSSAIARAQLAGGEKGRPLFGLRELSESHGGHWDILTGCRRGPLAIALEREGPLAAARELAVLVEAFGRENVTVELFDLGGPLDGARNDVLGELAVRAGVAIVATANAHYATPAGYPLASMLAAIRGRRTLDEADGWLPAWAGASLRSGAEQARRFRRYPGAIETAVELGRNCAFDLSLVAPGLPPFAVPEGGDEAGYLRLIAYEGARDRYGERSCERVIGAWAQIDRELEIIEALGFPGYFLIVYDIVEFCRRSNIFCQGRGSAANSAVCYALGITNADAVALGLLFERFLSPAREGPPDIDIDIESGRRDEVIAYIYARYGREHAAQVANVITYRPRSAVRDAGRALGYPVGVLDAWSREIGGLPWRGQRNPSETKQLAGGTAIPADVVSFAEQLDGLPRHLGIHSGGMVICDRPVIEVCPVEWARREGRSVLQWDKDDCAIVGLVKFDLLGLGMLEALHRMVDIAASFHGAEVDLARLSQEEAVYAMLASADSMGVFQVESRAQMATLPRLKPSCFYDLVVEIALIRPGPIQGGSVHPYLRRRNGEEEVTYLHPLLRPSLEKTLGVPLFQEQMMQIAIDVAGFSATDADQLRQAMGSKRSAERMARIKDRFYRQMAEREITGEVADAIYAQLAAFANYGFPESHAVSFAYLVYSSAWFKLHYPAVFLAGLLNSQPMGFWSPQSLVADARRHGVVIRRPHVNESEVGAILVPDATSATGAAVQLGISAVRGIAGDLAEKIVEGRPYKSLEDLSRRTQIPRAQMEALATAGACADLVALDGQSLGSRQGLKGRHSGAGRRRALWSAGALAGAGPDRLPGIVVGAEPPDLPPMTSVEETRADLWATGITPEAHPFVHLRSALQAIGVQPATALVDQPTAAKVVIAGVVTHRQRPSTAGGVVFMNLEDETGLVNVVCSPGCWIRFKKELHAPAVIIRGRLERVGEVCNVVAERVEMLDLAVNVAKSRDFR